MFGLAVGFAQQVTAEIAPENAPHGVHVITLFCVLSYSIRKLGPGTGIGQRELRFAACAAASWPDSCAAVPMRALVWRFDLLSAQPFRPNATTSKPRQDRTLMEGSGLIEVLRC